VHGASSFEVSEKEYRRGLLFEDGFEAKDARFFAGLHYTKQNDDRGCLTFSFNED
jgi:hypothetical protein